jgi:hypothetical protein
MPTLNNLSQTINISLKFLKSNGLPSLVCRNAGHLSAGAQNRLSRPATLVHAAARPMYVQPLGNCGYARGIEPFSMKKQKEEISRFRGQNGGGNVTFFGPGCGPGSSCPRRVGPTTVWRRAGRSSGRDRTRAAVARAGRVRRPNAHHGHSSPDGSTPARFPRQPPPRARLPAPGLRRSPPANPAIPGEYRRYKVEIHPLRGITDLK